MFSVAPSIRLSEDTLDAPVPVPVKVTNEPRMPALPTSIRTVLLVPAASTNAPSVSASAVLLLSLMYNVPLFSTNRPVSGKRLLLTSAAPPDVSELSSVNVVPGLTDTDSGSCVSGATAVAEAKPADDGAVRALIGSTMRLVG